MVISRRILLVDDHFVARSGVQALLEQAGHVVVGTAGDGLEAVEFLATNQVDVLVSDLEMPKMSGAELIRVVTKRFPRVKIVVLSSHTDDKIVATALQDGASAYVLKTGGGKELVDAVRTVTLGRIFLGNPLDKNGADFYKYFDLELSGLAELTMRERQIIQLVAEGHTSDEIGLILSISRRTVEKHRNNVMNKMEFDSLSDLIRFALKHQLISG